MLFRSVLHTLKGQRSVEFVSLYNGGEIILTTLILLNSGTNLVAVIPCSSNIDFKGFTDFCQRLILDGHRQQFLPSFHTQFGTVDVYVDYFRFMSDVELGKSPPTLI